MPRSILPLAVERQYVRLLYGWVVQWQGGVMAAALRWYERHPAREQFRTDATAGLPFPVETLRTTPSDIRAIGERVAAHNATTYERVVGIPIHDVLAPKRIDEFMTRNLDLISSLNESQVNELAPILGQAVAEGWASKVLQQKIAERFAVGQSRAELIARDQVLKLNAQVTRDRHEEAGIESYTWMTSGDERVRDTHAELEGEEFRYDDPPVTNEEGDTNNPGEDYQCRCTADPVLPTYDEETAEGADDDEETSDPEASGDETEVPDLAPEEVVQEFTDISALHPDLESAAVLPEIAPEVPEVVAQFDLDALPEASIYELRADLVHTEWSYRTKAELASLPDEQKQAISAYTYQYDWAMREVDKGVPSADIIEKVRIFRLTRNEEGDWPDASPEEHVALAEKYAADLRHVFRSAPLREEMSVYRGIAGLEQSKFSEIMTKDEITFEAMTSTSRNPQIAANFLEWTGVGEAPGDHSIMFQIRQRSGLPIESISQMTNEREILMRKGSEFRVIDRKRAPDRPNTAILVLEEVMKTHVDATDPKPPPPPPAPETGPTDARAQRFISLQVDVKIVGNKVVL